MTDSPNNGFADGRDAAARDIALEWDGLDTANVDEVVWVARGDNT